MIVEFGQLYLKELYEKGISDKKHRYQPQIVKRYKRCIDYLKVSIHKEDLFCFNSLHFETLKGDKLGLYSIRVNDQYRIEFQINENFEQPVLTICRIVELSNHYD